MAAKNYGTIAIVPDGNWNAAKQYKVGNVVTYTNGSSYLVHTIPPVGTVPTNEDYYQVSAQGGGSASLDAPGVVQPDGTTIGIDGVVISAKKATETEFGITTSGNGTKVNAEGKIDLDTNFEQAVNLANIIANEAFTSILGKISKSISVTMGLDENALLKSMLTNQMENNTNKIPTAALVYALNQTVINLNSNLTGYGENSDGKYWKFPDGTLICSSQKTFSNTPITTAWGTLFENASALNLGNFPYPFVSAPVSIQATTIGQAVGIERVALTSATAWGNTYFYMPMSVTLQTIIISLTAIGRWKN